MRAAAFLSGRQSGTDIEWADRELRIAELPLWQGLRAQPGVRRTFPFSIGEDANGLIHQTTPEAVRRAVTDAYAREDYAHITPPPGASAWANRLGRHQLDFVERWAAPGEDLSVLEIGAGSDFVATAIQRAWPAARYTVVDPSLRRAGDFEVIADYFPTDKLAGRRFGLILSFNCLEHVEEPAAFLRSLRGLLAPGDGRAILSFPDTERQLRAGDLNALTHEHMSYFTRDSALRLMARCGLRPLACETDEESLWIVVEAEAGGSDTDREKAAGSGLLPQVGDRFTDRLQRRAREVTVALRHGEGLAFHGANNGLNNFWYLAGLGDVENAQVFDCDRGKTGRYLPALPQPVRHCEDASYRDADRVYVSATMYFAENRVSYSLS